MEALQLTQDKGNVEILNFQTKSGVTFISIPLAFKVYGKPLYTAPTVVLTSRGLSSDTSTSVIEKMGEIIGEDKFIDTNTYSVIEFGFPGKDRFGFVYESYKNFSSADLDALLKLALKKLDLPAAFATITVD